ncbi:hypothetical protein [Mycobacterium sp. NPDC050441]|uniref:hypothetical protein n=1 Tax=Mycobacterium sp. NPDC050441 TaxID=3155403 RepID=UPI0033CD1FEA
MNIFARLLHPLRGRINQIFGVGDLLFDELQFAFDPLRGGLTEFVIVDDPGSLVVSGMGSRAFPVIGKLHSLPAGLRHHLIA